MSPKMHTEFSDSCTVIGSGSQESSSLIHFGLCVVAKVLVGPEVGEQVGRSVIALLAGLLERLAGVGVVLEPEGPVI